MKRKHWSERRAVNLYDLKVGDKFYMLHAPTESPYEVIKRPTDNGIMVFCKKPSRGKDYYYGSTRVVKQKLTDINPDL